jgi:hypothetical protein
MGLASAVKCDCQKLGSYTTEMCFFFTKLSLTSGWAPIPLGPPCVAAPVVLPLYSDYTKVLSANIRTLLSSVIHTSYLSVVSL